MSQVQVQFHVLAWDDKSQFARDFRILERVHGREVSDLEVERAYVRYVKLAVE